jgi:hypothetical protein
MPSGTQELQAIPECPEIAPAPAVQARGGRGRWAGRRIWSLLHAQALLNGTAGGRGDAAVIEDDYHRLAARRAG